MSSECRSRLNEVFFGRLYSSWHDFTEFARGGYGKVYKLIISEENPLGLPHGIYALKTNLDNKGHGEILNEVSNLRVLKYPNIIRLFASSYDPYSAYLIMPFHRVQLQQLVDESRLNWRQTLVILKSMTYVFHCISSHDDRLRTVHGDFKHNNVLVDEVKRGS
ncbi:unnamed protein product [Cuscuta campestris]|uniref:Protein kinase domain-containing protein n=1 Tax=Cuscuta campestris TaxID=132261 RepID=A0A484MY76_9ASTE|nr:unnamed protein product [Cuscuta campestris]